jgi:hypothetical protein
MLHSCRRCDFVWDQFLLFDSFFEFLILILIFLSCLFLVVFCLSFQFCWDISVQLFPILACMKLAHPGAVCVCMRAVDTIFSFLCLYRARARRQSARTHAPPRRSVCVPPRCIDIHSHTIGTCVMAFFASLMRSCARCTSMPCCARLSAGSKCRCRKKARPSASACKS